MYSPRRLAVAVIAFLSVFAVLGFSGTAAAQTYEAEELRLLEIINEYRQQNGLEPLLLSAPLSVASEHHSEDMGDYGFFSHTTEESSYYPVGADHSTRIAQEGYDYNTYTAENLAYGQATAEEVFEAWRASPDHNANMLGDYKVIGIGLVWVGGTPYWTTEFGAYVDPSASDPTGQSNRPEPEAQQAAQKRTSKPSVSEQPPAQDRQLAKKEQRPRNSAANEQYNDRSAANEQYAEEDGVPQPSAANQTNGRDASAAAEDQYGDASRVSVGQQETVPAAPAAEPQDAAAPQTEAAQNETVGTGAAQNETVEAGVAQNEIAARSGTAAQTEEPQTEQASTKNTTQSEKPSDTLSSLGITMLPDTGGAPLGALLAGGFLISAGLIARGVFR